MVDEIAAMREKHGRDLSPRELDDLRAKHIAPHTHAALPVAARRRDTLPSD